MGETELWLLSGSNIYCNQSSDDSCRRIQYIKNSWGSQRCERPFSPVSFSFFPSPLLARGFPLPIHHGSFFFPCSLFAFFVTFSLCESVSVSPFSASNFVFFIIFAYVCPCKCRVLRPLQIQRFIFPRRLYAALLAIHWS